MKYKEILRLIKEYEQTKTMTINGITYNPDEANLIYSGIIMTLESLGIVVD